MKCPVCADSTLLMADRQGVEVDYCPSCRGVWLDRGELDKLIERSTAMMAPPPGRPDWDDDDDDDRRRPRAYESERRYEGERRYDDDRRYHPHKRRNWLAELFD